MKFFTPTYWLLPTIALIGLITPKAFGAEIFSAISEFTGSAIPDQLCSNVDQQLSFAQELENSDTSMFSLSTTTPSTECSINNQISSTLTITPDSGSAYFLNAFVTFEQSSVVSGEGDTQGGFFWLESRVGGGSWSKVLGTQKHFEMRYDPPGSGGDDTSGVYSATLSVVLEPSVATEYRIMAKRDMNWATTDVVEGESGLTVLEVEEGFFAYSDSDDDLFIDEDDDDIIPDNPLYTESYEQEVVNTDSTNIFDLSTDGREVTLKTTGIYFVDFKSAFQATGDGTDDLGQNERNQQMAGIQLYQDNRWAGFPNETAAINYGRRKQEGSEIRSEGKISGGSFQLIDVDADDKVRIRHQMLNAVSANDPINPLEYFTGNPVVEIEDVPSLSIFKLPTGAVATSWTNASGQDLGDDDGAGNPLASTLDMGSRLGPSQTGSFQYVAATAAYELKKDNKTFLIGYKAGGKLRETVSPTCPTNAPDARSSFTVWLEFDDNEDGNWEEIPGSRRHGLLRHVGHCDGTTTNESSDGSASVEGVIAHTAELQVNKDYLVRLRIKLDRVLTSNETFESVPEQNTITLIEI